MMKFSLPPVSLLLALFFITGPILQNLKGDDDISYVTEVSSQDLDHQNSTASEDQVLWNTLSTEDQKNLLNNQSVCKQEPSQSTETFTFNVYRLIDATPLQAVSIFWDTDMTKQILPNFQSIQVEKNQLHSIVATYTVGIPSAPWPYNTDTVKSTSTLQKLSSTDYQISCVGAGVKGKSLVIKVEGNLQAIAHEGKTLLCYRVSTLLDKNAYFIKMSSLNDQQKGAHDIAVKTVEKLVSIIQNTTVFEKHIKKVTTALGSEAL